MLSDDKLIDQIKYGNERAAEELITRYYASILRYCRWHCSSVEKAEDLTQEIFYKLFKNISGYQGKRKFKAYLYTIANRVCIDESRKIHFCPLEDEESIVDECNEILRLVKSLKVLIVTFNFETKACCEVFFVTNHNVNILSNFLINFLSLS